MVNIGDAVIVVKTGTNLSDEFIDENAKVLDINLGKVKLTFADGLQFWTELDTVIVNPDGFL